MDRRAQLRQDILFAEALLARDSYSPSLKTALALAKQQLEEELSVLEEDGLGERQKDP
jgi:hypothetical protein